MCVGLTVGYVCGSVYWVVSYCEGHTCLSFISLNKLSHDFDVIVL